MSVTTTANCTSTVLRVLRDYEVHHGDSEPPSEVSLKPRPDYSDPLARKAPQNWPTQYRNIPEYKPINRNLDMTTRPGGANLAEQIFIATLLNGCRINAVSVGAILGIRDT